MDAPRAAACSHPRAPAWMMLCAMLLAACSADDGRNEPESSTPVTASHAPTGRGVQDRNDTIAHLLELLASTGKPAAEVVAAGVAAAADPRNVADPELYSLALSVRCRGYYRSSALAAAQQSCDEARAMAKSPLSRFAALRMQATLIAERGHPTEAIPLFLESLEAAERSGNRYAVAAALSNLGAVAQFSGANAEAIDYYDKSLAIASKIGATGLQAIAGSNLGYLLVENGKADLARETFARALQAAVKADARQAEFTSRNGLAHAQLAAGQPEQAAAAFKRLMSTPTIHADSYQLAEGKMFLARAELAAGQTAAAEISARAAIDGLSQSSPLRAYPAYAVLIDALVANRKLTEADTLSSRMMAIVPETSRGRFELLKSRAKLLSAANRHREAFAVLLEADHVREAQSLARAEDRLSFMRARNEAVARESELTALREQQALVASRASQDRLTRNFSLILAACALLGALVYWSTVRTRRRLESQIARRQHIEALGKLTGGVAHDFNNLMTIVRQSMGLLRRDSTMRRMEHLMMLVNEADDAARVGGEITQQLLAFARHKVMKPEIVTLPTLIERNRALLERTLGASMTLAVRMAPDIGPIHVDPAQLTSALINLLANARDAMEARGVVELDVAGITVVDRDNIWPDVAPGRYIAISVVDTGRGMTPDVLRQAVTPFFTTRADSDGSGLGLSMVDGFVSQSGGALHIESSIGRGTTVTALFPRIATVEVP